MIGFLICFSKFLPAQDAPISTEEEFERLGQSVMTFLDIDVGARSVGMGSASTCIDNDVNALFWNPAGIAKIKGGSLALNSTQWIADTKQYGFASAYGMNNVGTFGISFMIMDHGSIERTVPTSEYDLYPQGFLIDGTFTIGQWVAGLAYAREITDKFCVGGQIKYVYEDLGDTDIAEYYSENAEYDTLENVKNKANTIALDFGTVYYFGFHDLRIAMSCRNFSQTIKYAYESFHLPITFKVGMAMNVFSFLSEMDKHELQLALTWVNPYDGGERIHIGSEYVFNKIFALRAGYRTNTDIGAFSVGFGFIPGSLGKTQLGIDYAYSSADKVFGSIHRFAFNFAF
jgi:hypothetical protein